MKIAKIQTVEFFFFLRRAPVCYIIKQDKRALLLPVIQAREIERGRGRERCFISIYSMICGV